MRNYSFGKASRYALENTVPKKRDAGCDGCGWLFSRETDGVWGIPSGSGMKHLNVPDDYPYPSAEIGTKEQLYRSLLKGECIPTSCASGYEFIMMGKGRKRKLLDDYFEKLPEGAYVLLSVDWD